MIVTIVLVSDWCQKVNRQTSDLHTHHTIQSCGLQKDTDATPGTHGCDMVFYCNITELKSFCSLFLTLKLDSDKNLTLTKT